MAQSHIDPARLEGAALKRWYLRSPTDIDQERRQAAAQRYRDFFRGAEASNDDGVRDSTLATATSSNRIGIGYGAPQSGQYRTSPASPPTEGAGGNFQLTAAWPPSPNSICQACHGPSVLPPPPPVLYRPPRSPGGNPPSPGGGESSGQNPKQCAVQYENDASICRWVPGMDARRRCWESATRREAHCIQTKGEVGFPDLVIR